LSWGVSTYFVDEFMFKRWQEETAKPFKSQFGIVYGSMPKCEYCKANLQIGEKIRIIGLTDRYQHFDCWKADVQKRKAIGSKLKLERAKQKEYWQTHPHPAKVYRMSSAFLRSFYYRKGMILTCPNCGIHFHPCDLWTTEKIGDNSRIIHAKCCSFGTHE
jgi:hypothetical protein